MTGLFLSVPPVLAQTNEGLQYTLLEKIPGFNSLDGSDFPGYIKAIYRLALIIIVLSAVVMISIGGFMYLTSAGNTSALGSAKGVIYDAIIGLVIALVAWLLLNVINPDLVNISINSLSPVTLPTPAPTPPGAPPATPPGTPPAGSGTGCGGYSVSGINSSQCSDASQGLSDILQCMNNKFPGTKLTSISDSAGFSTCKNNWNDSACAHSKTSCHYGGGASKTASECQKSQAADISIRGASGAVDLNMARAIKSAASACGARVNDESGTSAPHIHISAPTNCCNK